MQNSSIFTTPASPHNQIQDSVIHILDYNSLFSYVLLITTAIVTAFLRLTITVKGTLFWPKEMLSRSFSYFNNSFNTTTPYCGPTVVALTGSYCNWLHKRPAVQKHG